MLYHFDNAVDRTARVDAEKRTAYMHGHINQTKASNAGKSRIVKEGTQLRVQKSIMKNAVIVFPVMLFCMMPTHLYSSNLSTVEFIGLYHHTGIDKSGLSLMGFNFFKGSFVKTITGNFYVGGSGGFITSLERQQFLTSTSSGIQSMIGLAPSSIPLFISALYEVKDWAAVKLDVELIKLLFATPSSAFENENMFVTGPSYFASAFANVGSPTLSLHFNIYKDFAINVSCSYNHNAILKNWMHNKVLDAQKTLRDEYKSLMSVDDVNNFFKQNTSLSYFSIGIGIGFIGRDF